MNKPTEPAPLTDNMTVPDEAGAQNAAAASEGAATTPESSTQEAQEATVTLASAEYEELLKKAERAEQLHEALLRKTADYENFRRRSLKEKEDLRLRHIAVMDVLAVADNLERAMQAVTVAGADEAILQGMSMVHDQLLAILQRKGIERIQAVDQPFDPMLHEAIMTVEDPQRPPNTVTAEVQAGYRCGDQILRHSRVVVTRRPITQEASETGTTPPETMQEEQS